MRGLMMDRPLLVSSLIEHAGRVHASAEVVSRSTDGSIHRTTWGGVASRSRRLASALEARGVGRGERVATLAWNNHRHLELYFGVSGMGAVLHTLNPRLHPAQLAWVVEHAQDRLLFLDTTFLPLVEALADGLPSVEAFVLLEGRGRMPSTTLRDVVCYEELMEEGGEAFTWPDLDENDASSLCYTSGTTGNPKGVLYSHRSTVLHAWAVSLPGTVGLPLGSSFLPVVPMFHANAWGTPYSCAMSGSKYVLPGPGLDGSSLTALMRAEGVTCAAGVPTVWMGLLAHWRASGERVPTLRMVTVGGSAPSSALIRSFEEEFGIEVVQGWGMTEMSPVGSIQRLTPSQRELPVEERVALIARQGQPVFGVEIKLVGEDGEELPWDGESVGELLVRGAWVCSGYFEEGVSDVHRDGWLATGDVVTLDPDGTIRIRDRAKDLIKSGGEWISSIDLENAAMGHPGVAQAAVIGIPDDTWGERPLLFGVPGSGAAPVAEEVLEFLSGKVAKWWLPERIVFRAELPLGGTGKVQKTRLRDAWLAESAGGGAQQTPLPGA